MRWLARAGRALVLVLALASLGLAVLAIDIARFGQRDEGGTADAALVLGAAVLWDRPSPVLAERLRHAVALYESGRVGKLVLTGGLSPEDRLTEAEAGRQWVLAQGVPDADIILEERSRTTLENFAFSAPILEAHGIRSVLVVSDPIHMRRAMAMAERYGLEAAPSPTSTSRYVSLGTQMPFLLRETWFMAQYLLTGR